jgi:hypothetical protein
VGEQLERGAVGPVQILEDRQDRRLGDEQLHDRVEQLEPSLLAGIRRGAQEALERRARRAVAEQPRGDLRPRTIRRRALVLETQPARDGAGGIGRELLGQPALAETGLTAQDDHAAPAACRVVPGSS